MLTENQKKDLKETGGIKTTKDIIKNSIDHHHKYDFIKYEKNYKMYLGFNLDRLQVIEDWQSNISYPISRSIIDTLFANMYDFGYEFGVLSSDIRKLLNSTFDYKGQGKEVLKKIIKEGLIVGRSFCRTGIIEINENIELFDSDKKIKRKIKKPIIEYLSVFNVYYDTNYSVEESPYVIIRDMLKGSSIKEKYNLYLDEEGQTKLNYVIKNNDKTDQSEFKMFNNYDFNPVKRILDYQHYYVDSIRQNKKRKQNIKTTLQFFTSLTGGGAFGSNDDVDYKNLYLVDNSKTYEVIEYIENGEVKLFVNGEYIGKYKTLLGGLDKIREIKYNEIPGSNGALGVMDIVGDLQLLLNSIWNSFVDNIKLQLTGMFKVRGNVGGIGRNKMTFNKFGLLILKGDSDIQRFEMGLGDFMPLNVVQYIEGFLTKMAGMNDYQLGGQHKVERVADGIDFMRSQYKSKLAVMIDSIQRLMSNISKEWLLIYLMKFSEKELKKLGIKIETKEDEYGEKEYYIGDVTISEILSEENITFTYNALETIDMERDREKIMMLYQPLLQNNKVNKDELWNVALGKKFRNIWKDINEGRKTIDNSGGLSDAGKTMQDNLSDKYTGDIISDSDSQQEVEPLQPVYNSAVMAKTPGGAKLRKITHELNSNDITDRLSI